MKILPGWKFLILKVSLLRTFLFFFDTPPWVDGLVAGLRRVPQHGSKCKLPKRKKEALEKELREVSIRVNLFEKILIPAALANIKKIKVFLGIMQLAAVSQAKVAKHKDRIKSWQHK